MILLLKIATIVRRIKVWVLQLRQEFNNNKDNDHNRKHIDETACVRDAGND
jgi:hypothetical protein